MAVVATGRNEQRLAELAEAIGAPDRIATVAVDLTDDDAPSRIVDTAVERWGRIDFLINNAGVGNPTPVDGPTTKCSITSSMSCCGRRFGWRATCCRT